MEELEKEGFVTLMDDEGKPHEFEHLDTFEFNDEVYVVLCEEGMDEVLIFRLGADDDNKEALFSIEDEAELDMAFEEFKNRMSEEFDFQDEE